MKKLKLNLDEIKVESFETNPIQSKIGTVMGHLPESAFCNSEETCNNCGGGTGTNVPACSDVFCTQGAHCPTGQGWPSCYVTGCGTCQTDCGTCVQTCPPTCLIYNCV